MQYWNQNWEHPKSKPSALRPSTCPRECLWSWHTMTLLPTWTSLSPYSESWEYLHSESKSWHRPMICNSSETVPTNTRITLNMYMRSSLLQILPMTPPLLSVSWRHSFRARQARRHLRSTCHHGTRMRMFNTTSCDQSNPESQSCQLRRSLTYTMSHSLSSSGREPTYMPYSCSRNKRQKILWI